MKTPIEVSCWRLLLKTSVEDSYWRLLLKTCTCQCAEISLGDKECFFVVETLIEDFSVFLCLLCWRQHYWQAYSADAPMWCRVGASARRCGGLHEHKENIKIQSWNISVSARRHVGMSAHAGLDSISLCNPNVRIMYVPTHRRADEHSFKVVSIVLNEIKLCGNAPTRRQCRNLFL